MLKRRSYSTCYTSAHTNRNTCPKTVYKVRHIGRLTPQHHHKIKRETKNDNIPFPFPTPSFSMHAKSLAPSAKTHWSVSSMKGSLTVLVPHNEFLLKPHLRASLKGLAKPGYEIPNGTFSFQSAPPLFFHSAWKIWIEKILSLLFLLCNKGTSNMAALSALRIGMGMRVSKTAVTWREPHGRGQSSLCNHFLQEIGKRVAGILCVNLLGSAKKGTASWQEIKMVAPRCLISYIMTHFEKWTMYKCAESYSDARKWFCLIDSWNKWPCLNLFFAK